MQGFINAYKPSGDSSARIVNLVKKKFHVSKVGHMGTLDPMAQGVLPIAVGKATRMFDYFLQKNKTYVVKMQFGYFTDTLDKLGVVVQSDGAIPNKNQVQDILHDFVGEIDQLPPAYSAKNVNGTRAYKLARSGQHVDLKPNKVLIEEILLLNMTHDVATLQVTCGSGTYIRSLVRDIALSLNTCATMIYLERTKSGYFEVNEAINLELAEQSLEELIIPIPQVFPHIKCIEFDANATQKLCNGIGVKVFKKDGIYFALSQEQLLGVVQISNNYAKIKTYLKED